MEQSGCKGPYAKKIERQYGTSLSKICSALKKRSVRLRRQFPFIILDNRAERFGSKKWVCAMVPPLDVLAIENGKSKWLGSAETLANALELISKRGPGS